MASPKYYIPGARLPITTENPVKLAEQLGPELTERWRDLVADPVRWEQQVQLRGCRNGPDSGEGLLLRATPPGRPIHPVAYVAATQQWTQISTGLWVGLNHSESLDPLDLVRHKPTSGVDARLGGHVWHVPTIRQLGRFCTLPRAMVRVNGLFETRVRPAYNSWWEMSARVWDLITTGKAAEWEEVYDLCSQALGLNYRVGDWELEQLAPIDTESFRDIFAAITDFDAAMKLLAESTQPATGDPPPGPGAGSP